MELAHIRWAWKLERTELVALQRLCVTMDIFPAGFADNDNIEKWFGPGVFGLFAFSGERPIAAARLFSDGLTTAWLAEIAVAPDWRGRGLGHSLIDRINDRFGKMALYCDTPAEIVHFFDAKGIKPKIKLHACRRHPGAVMAKVRTVPSIAIHDDASRHTFVEFDHVLDSVGFGLSARGVSREELYARVFGAGVFGSFAVNGDDELVGIVRVFSDLLSKCYVTEVCVHPEWQRKGVGRALLDRIVQRFFHTAIYTEAFPDAVSLFQSCGIIPDHGLVGCSRAPIE